MPGTSSWLIPFAVAEQALGGAAAGQRFRLPLNFVAPSRLPVPGNSADPERLLPGAPLLFGTPEPPSLGTACPVELQKTP